MIRIRSEITVYTALKGIQGRVLVDEWLEQIEPSDFSLEGYEHHAPMTAPMAV